MFKRKLVKIRRTFRNPFLKLLFTSALYTIWVLWVETYWLFSGLIILTDVHLTRFINWRFWRKRLPKGRKHKWKTELFDSLIWAVLIAIFIRVFLFEAYTIPTSSMEKSLLVGDYILVNKVKYGPRLPMTPITIPFTHNTLPISRKTKNSFISSTQLPYRRLRGTSEIKRFDVVVFNYPEGDTVIQEMPEKSYYSMCREYGTQAIRSRYKLLYRPVDKRDNYIKRVVGMPGDTIKIQHGIAYFNEQPERNLNGIQYNYSIKMLNENDTSLLDTIGVSPYDIKTNDYNDIYTLPLTELQYHEIIDKEYFKAIVKYENIDPTEANKQIFPFNDHFTWTEDNYGPISIPQRGIEIEINMKNIPLYFRILTAYEGNKVEIKNNLIYINDIVRHTYTFKMNYYFMLGDNRHNSNDSRYWGFVPENHIIGQARLTWLSLDKNKSFPDNIRWNKMVKFIR